MLHSWYKYIVNIDFTLRCEKITLRNEMKCNVCSGQRNNGQKNRINISEVGQLLAMHSTLSKPTKAFDQSTFTSTLLFSTHGLASEWVSFRTVHYGLPNCGLNK